MLTGKLVRLRPLDMTDLENFLVWYNDPEVTEYLNFRYALPRLAEEEWLRARTGKPVSFSNLMFSIEALADSRHVGSIDLHEASAEDRKATLGIAIGDKEYWSRGYGTDAIVTLLRFAFDEMNLHRVALHCDERNGRGLACYRKCGFVEEGRLRQDRYRKGRYWDTVVMGVLREEFEALHGRQEAQS